MAKGERKVYADNEVAAKLEAELPTWKYRDGWIRRKYTTGGWPYTLMVVNTIGYIAEAAFHHPDLTVSWAEVHVKLSTHSHKGITDNDFELAKLIEDQVMWTPREEQALDGFEAGMKKKWTR